MLTIKPYISIIPPYPETEKYYSEKLNTLNTGYTACYKLPY